MSSTVIVPNKLTVAFCNAGDKSSSIPLTVSSGDEALGKVSFSKGWPSVCGLPTASGGVAPTREDFNEIFNIVTRLGQWQSVGGAMRFDANHATAINGYPVGATVLSTTNNGYWINTVDGNTNDPDSISTGWTKDWGSGGGGGGGGIVNTVTVVATHGFSGSSSGGTNPQLTLSTTVTTGSILKSNSGSLAAAVDGTDYLSPTTGVKSGGAQTASINTTAHTSNYTVVDTDYFVIMGGTSALTLTLPVASSHAGRILQIMNTNNTGNYLNFINGPIRFANFVNLFGYPTSAQPSMTVAGIFSDGTYWISMNYAPNYIPPIQSDGG